MTSKIDDIMEKEQQLLSKLQEGIITPLLYVQQSDFHKEPYEEFLADYSLSPSDETAESYFEYIENMV
jgi:hypothetical protein